MDYYYLQFLGWMSSLTDGELLEAVIYGVVSGGVVTGGYAWFVRLRRHDRAVQMRATPSRYFRIRLGR